MDGISYEVIERYFDKKLADKSENTKRTRLADLRNYDRWLRENGHDDPTEIEANDLDNYLREQKGLGYANYTIESRWETLRGMYEKLGGMMGEMPESPFEDLRRKDYVEKRKAKKDKNSRNGMVYVEPEEVKQLAENVSNPEVRNELLVRLIFQTGIRRREAANIKIEHIWPDDRGIDVFSDKTEEWRTVYYNQSLDFLMDQWLNTHRASIPAAESSPYLFISPRGQISPQRINDIIKEAAENAGIQEEMYNDMSDQTRFRITTHALRHGHGVHAIKCGIDPKSVQLHMGHEDIEQTMDYVRLVQSDVRDAYRGKWTSEV